ncbi:hypothetical protein LCGC14_0634190 [marine sediment metagenome]|uniref:Uncharacterized protein n=1 Tax=marine sediment metagenome TaxID=412755 RepID=A0A0F9R136_9ZZZZ
MIKKKITAEQPTKKQLLNTSLLPTTSSFIKFETIAYMGIGIKKAKDTNPWLSLCTRGGT